MSDARSLVSVGLDVGTTTTQLVFSRLTLNDAARPGQAPRITIAGRAILHQSPIFFTPLADPQTVDAARLTERVRHEYAAAGIEPRHVETGAVIITGETAKKQNADEILRALAGLAGDFVVAVAGPHLESLIAGRGSGAARYSQEHFKTVTNVDIGGGSANSAIFRQGRLLAAAAMNYGGRIVVIDRETGRLRHIADPARLILEDCGLRWAVGDAPGLLGLRRFAERMADLTLELIEGTAGPLAQRLYLTPPSPASGKGTTLMFSGGIGLYYYEPISVDSVAAVAVHEDVGPLLADALRRHPGLQGYAVERPAETMRATVLGASAHTVTLSGSTIWAERDLLPLRNVPVVRPAIAGDHRGSPLPAGHVGPAPPGDHGGSPLPAGHAGPASPGDHGGSPLPAGDIAAAIAEAVRRWAVDPRTDLFAVALEMGGALDYNRLLTLAGGLAEFARALPAGRPLIVVIERDYAQALGQTVKGLAPGRPLLVIDQVGLDEGDYIDIGAPLMDGRVVPLSVKTLVFYH